MCDKRDALPADPPSGKTVEATCMACCAKPVTGKIAQIISHIRYLDYNSPENYGWEKIDDKWHCRKCVEDKR